MKRSIAPVTSSAAAISATAFAGILAVLAFSAGCVGSGLDYYSELVDVCDYRTASTEFRSGAEVVETSLTPECKEELMLLLPFDDSWANAPAGLQDKVIEAFQVVLAYPLALPPGNKILGPESPSIHARQICVLAPELFEDCPGSDKSPNPNLSQNAFNFLMDRVTTIKYLPPAEADGESASLTPDLFRLHGPGYLLSITDGFWSGTSDFSMTPFRRASILMHEAWHGDSRSHTLCDSESDVKGFSCDPDISGPYFFEAAYLVALIHGSALLRKEPAPPPGQRYENGALDLPILNDDEAELPEYLISDLDLAFISFDICTNLLYRVMTTRELVADTGNCGVANARWILQKQGIVRD